MRGACLSRSLAAAVHRVVLRPRRGREVRRSGVPRRLAAGARGRRGPRSPGRWDWVPGTSRSTGSTSASPADVDGEPLVFYHFHAFRSLGGPVFNDGLTSYGTMDRSVRRYLYGGYVRELAAAGETARPPPSGRALIRARRPLGWYSGVRQARVGPTSPRSCRRSSPGLRSRRRLASGCRRSRACPVGGTGLRLDQLY